ncbi:MAG: hypothetical protein ACTSRI_04395 [Promethearchaeota archaeon]
MSIILYAWNGISFPVFLTELLRILTDPLIFSNIQLDITISLTECQKFKMEYFHETTTSYRCYDIIFG